jgi:hypothetical protein
MNKECVDGVILILSCQKHKETRLKDFKLKKNTYLNWKVIYVIGDLFLSENYILKNNILFLKTEDSYIHLLKKLSLSIKYLNEIYNIKNGILRCGDDLIFNEKKLINFIEGPKYDFYGKAYCGKNFIVKELDFLKITKIDNFMINYYKNHKEDFSNPQHNLKNVNIELYLKRPKIWGPAGVIYYLSNKSCKILIDHMEKINYNIFHYDEFTKSYPYTIEDCAVTFIMYFNKINFTNNNDFFDTPNSIVKHTNKYK